MVYACGVLIRDAAKMFGQADQRESVSTRTNKEPFVPQFRLPPGERNVTESGLTPVTVEMESLARDYVESRRKSMRLRCVRRFPLKRTDWQCLESVQPEQRGEEVAAEERTRPGLGDGPDSRPSRVVGGSCGGAACFTSICPRRLADCSPATTNSARASPSTAIIHQHAATGRSLTNTAIF